jgi:hypothetical protein
MPQHVPDLAGPVADRAVDDRMPLGAHPRSFKDLADLLRALPADIHRHPHGAGDVPGPSARLHASRRPEALAGELLARAHVDDHGIGIVDQPEDLLARDETRPPGPRVSRLDPSVAWAIHHEDARATPRAHSQYPRYAA